MQTQTSLIKPMLCYEVEANSTVKQQGLDGAKATAAYRKAIREKIAELQLRGFVAERKGWSLKPPCGISRRSISLVLEARTRVLRTAIQGR